MNMGRLFFKFGFYLLDEGFELVDFFYKSLRCFFLVSVGV